MLKVMSQDIFFILNFVHGFVVSGFLLNKNIFLIFFVLLLFFFQFLLLFLSLFIASDGGPCRSFIFKKIKISNSFNSKEFLVFLRNFLHVFSLGMPTKRVKKIFRFSLTFL